MLLQLPFLPQAGDGIGCKLGVLRHGFPIVEIRIGLDRRLLRLCRVPPGFQLAFRPPVLDTAVSVAHSLLKAAFPQVARLDAGIFLLHLPDLAVDRRACLLNGAGQWIGMGLSRTLIGDRVPGGIQPVRRLVRLADSFFQLRRRPVCLRKLQTGGRAVPGRLTLPEGVAPLAPRFFRLAPFHMALHLVHRPAQCPRRFISRGIVLFLGAVRNVGGLAGHQVHRNGPVTGHLLGLLLGGFPFLHLSVTSSIGADAGARPGLNRRDIVKNGIGLGRADRVAQGFQPQGPVFRVLGDPGDALRLGGPEDTAVHPWGKPMSHSTQSGFSAAFSESGFSWWMICADRLAAGDFSRKAAGFRVER